jgi:hypothetical protein
MMEATVKIDEQDKWQARFLSAAAQLRKEQTIRITVQIENAELAAQSLRQQLVVVQEQEQKAKSDLNGFAEQLQAKYELHDGDKIDFETGEITAADQATER